MAEKRDQRRLAAILVADVVGYSRLMEADEAGTLGALRERRASILDPVVKERGGRVVKVMGDGVLVEFASAVNSVKAAIELQNLFSKENESLPEDRRILLRIGINLGDVVGEGEDIYGDGVNIAARIEQLADPSGICISGKVFEEVRGKLDKPFDDLGDHALKNIGRPVRIYRWRAAGTVVPPRPAPSLPDRPSIAVLPFQNMSGDPEQEYFADGMVEEIITVLSRTRWLFVIARNSSFTYKGRAVDVKQVGRELGVRYVLEGSVRKAGGRVRITGQLVDAATGAHLWAERFDGSLENIFELQDQVTASVVGAIAPKMEQAEIERAKRKPTESLDAYDYYLRGIAGLYPWTREANGEAMAMFHRAIELDPGFAAAYGMLGRCFSQRKASGWVTRPDAEELAEAERVGRLAVEHGRDDAVALGGGGITLGYVVGDVEAGISAIERALSLDPNYAWGWLFSAWMKVWTGDAATALDHVARAIRLSPNDPHAFSMISCVAFAHFISGRFDEGLANAERALAFRRDLILATSVAAASAAFTGNMTKASGFLEMLLKTAPQFRISDAAQYFHFRRPQDLSSLLDGLHKAGLPE